MKKFKTMGSNVYASTVKNNVGNECDDHQPNMSDAQDERLFNSEKEKQEVFYLKMKTVNLKVMPIEVELHQRNSIIGSLLKRFQEINIDLLSSLLGFSALLPDGKGNPPNSSLNSDVSFYYHQIQVP